MRKLLRISVAVLVALLGFLVWAFWYYRPTFERVP